LTSTTECSVRIPLPEQFAEGHEQNLDVEPDAPIIEVARADARHEKMQQYSTRPLQHGSSRLHFQKQKPALRDVNSFASSTGLNKVLMATGRLSLI
jgi:hypothetical protein